MLFAIIGNFLFAALGISSLLSAIILTRQVVLSEEYKDKKTIKRLVQGMYQYPQPSLFL